MLGSLAIAAAPLTMLLVVLWAFDRQAGRSGALLILSVLWGGLIATSLVMLMSSLWLEQPSWYPYVVAPAAEELAKGLLFLALLSLRRVQGVTAGIAYGLACGLGFALWENAAYFERGSLGGLTVWLFVTRTAGAALLHAVSTATIGAAAGALGGSPGVRARHLLLLALALALAFGVHAAWNYVCLVLSDTTPLRRVLPASAATVLLAVLAWSVVRERWHLRREILSLWQEGLIGEVVAKAMMTRWPWWTLRRLGQPNPGRLDRAIWALALARRRLEALGEGRGSARLRARRAIERCQERLQSALDPRASALASEGASRLKKAFLGVGLGLVALVLHLLGQLSPVPAALAQRTIVITAGATVRPEPVITVMGEDAYLLWQKGPSKTSRQQMLTWVGPGGQRQDRSLGELPPEEADWFEMGALGEGVVVATRHSDELWLRAFTRSRQRGELRLPAPEAGPEPCWPWLSSDGERSLLGWDRLGKAVFLAAAPFALRGEVMSLPDPFPGFDTPEQGCARGFLLTDQTIYEVARPTKAARMAAIDLERRSVTPLELCPGEPSLRVHSLDKDRGQVLVLLGGEAEGGSSYRLLLARLDRTGRVIEPCRHLRDMPAGEPSVVGLAGAGDSAFLAWATTSHVLLARIPLNAAGGRPRRWVLDRTPRDGSGVVRVGVVEHRLYVAWEGASPGGRWSLKLLRTEIDGGS